MNDLKIGDKVFCFLGMNLEKFIITSIDEIRVFGENNESTFCFYKDSCFKKKEEAINSMIEYCLKFKKLWLKYKSNNQQKSP